MLGFNSFWRQWRDTYDSEKECEYWHCWRHTRQSLVFFCYVEYNDMYYLKRQQSWSHVCMHVASRISLNKYMQMYGRISSCLASSFSSATAIVGLCCVWSDEADLPVPVSTQSLFGSIGFTGSVCCVYLWIVLFGGPEWELWWWWHSFNLKSNFGL